nr:hypothetical protein [Tanacetum cinerariifolium]
GNPQQALQDKGVIDSGCSRHMTRNISFLLEYKETIEDMLHLEGILKVYEVFEMEFACKQMFQVLVKHHTSNSHQFTMSNRHQELTSPEQTASATVEKVNGDVQLQALIDDKKVVVTEAIIKRDLHLDDADGVEYLPNAEIFEQLTRMGY